MFFKIIFATVLFISLVILTSYLGIYFSKKYEFVGNLSSKRNTLILLIISSLFAAFKNFQQTQDLAYSIGGAMGAMGFVLVWPFIMGYMGTFFIKRVLKNNSITNKDYWSSIFFFLIWVIIFIIFNDK